MGKSVFTDRDVVYQIAQILVGEISRFQPVPDQPLRAGVEALIDSGSAPLITYGTLAAELNRLFNLESSANRFTAQNIDPFLGVLLKESINYEYKIEGLFHMGKIRKKMELDLPVTAIVVNAKTHLPGRQFYTYFKTPAATEQELRASAVEMIETLFAFNDWNSYLKRVDKVFGKK